MQSFNQSVDNFSNQPYTSVRMAATKRFYGRRQNMPDDLKQFVRNIWKRWGWWNAFGVAVFLAVLVYVLFLLLRGAP